MTTLLFRAGFLFALLLAAVSPTRAQVALDVNVPYTQGFGGLGGGAFTDNVTLPGWYLSAGAVVADDGSAAAQAVYAYGSGEAALGSNGGAEYGVRFVNTSAYTINCLQVSYTGEQWRVAEAGTPTNPLQHLRFFYGAGGSGLSLGSAGTAVGALDFAEVTNDNTCGTGGVAQDGNANSGGRSTIITGLNVAPGEEIFIKWVDQDNACEDHGMAVDDVTVTAFTNELPPVTANSTIVSTCTFVADWTSVPGATDYLIDVSTDPAFGSFVGAYSGLSVGNTTTYVVTGLMANTTYYFRIRANTPCGLTPYSNTGEATTLNTLPIPTATAATNIGCTSFDANWDALPGALGYRLDVATDAAFSAILPGYNNLNVNNVLTYPVTGLNVNTVYFYRIRALSDCGTTANSGTISTNTLPLPAAPGVLAQTLVTACGFNANWTAVAGATGYLLDVSTNNLFSSFVYQDIPTGVVTTYAVSGLSPTATYYYRVRAINACGTSNYSGVRPVTTSGALGTVTSGAASAIGCTSFQANWTALAAATGYQLEVALDAGFTSYVPGYSPMVLGAVTNHVVTGLALNTPYYYRLRGLNGCGTATTVSVVRTLTTLNITGPTVANPATNINCTAFRANWTAVAGATSYRIDVSTDPGFGSFVLNDFNPGNTTNYTVTGLTLNTTYYYRIRVVNACGASINSNTVTVTTTALPAAPVELPADNIACTSFRANWTAVAGATSYTMDVSTDPAFGSFIAGYNNVNVGNVVLRNVAGLVAGTTYYYRIRAVSACGTSVNSGVESLTTNAPPVAPSNIVASNITNCGFTFSWDPEPGATSYGVQRAADVGFTVIQSTVNTIVPTTYSYPTGLVAGTTYYVRVRTVNACGTSAYSAPIAVTTLPLPTAPTAPTLSNPGCNTLDFAWGAVLNATGYQITVRTGSCAGAIIYNNLDVGNVTNYTIAGLNPGITYFVTVRAYINTACAVQGAVSACVSMATTAMPAAPATPTATNIQCYEFTGNWIPVGGLDGYIVDLSTNNTFTALVPGYAGLDVGNVNAFTFTGLSATTTYYLRVRGYTACGVTAVSGTRTVLTLSLSNTPVATAATNVLCYQFQANWALTTGAQGFEIDISDDPAFVTSLPGYPLAGLPLLPRTHICTGLTEGTTYYYRVRGTSVCGTSAWSNTITLTTQDILPAPNATAATLIQRCSFRANWQAVAGALNYRIDISTDPLFGSFVVNNANVVAPTLLYNTGAVLTEGTTYYYRVRAENACGASVNSNVVAVTTLPTLPVPVATAATLINCTSFRANWQTVPGAASYRVDVSLSPIFATFVVNNATVTAPTIFRDVTGLAVNTTYYYRIRAVDACGTTLSSNVITVTTLDVPPATLASPATNITNCQFRANWLLVANATNYRIDVSLSPVFATFVVNNVLTGNVNNYLVGGLLPNTTYYFRIRPVNACGTGANSNVITVTTLPDPVAPVLNPPVVVLCNGFTVDWNAVPNANGYFIDISTSPTFATFIAGHNNLNIGNVLTYTATGLAANTTYYVRVRAYIGVPCTPSPNSNVETILTNPIQVAPVATAATNVGCTSFDANWNAAAAATGYLLYVNTAPGFGAATMVPGYNGIDVGNVLTYPVTGLNINTTYYYRLVAYNPACTSGVSNTINRLTLNVPAQATTLAATNILCDQFQANWSATATATGYILQVSTDAAHTTPVAGYNDIDVGNVTTYPVTGLTAGTTYYYRLRAYNVCGLATLYSTNRTVITVPNLVAGPTAIAASVVTQCSFNARWNALANVQGYYLDVSTDPAFGAGNFVPGYEDVDVANVILYPVTGLTPGTTYYYRVRGYNNCGTSPNSNTITQATLAVPIPVANVATNILACQFQANWTNPAGTPATTGFIIDVSTDVAFGPGTFVPGYENLAVPLAPLNLVVTGLSASTNYYYRVRAVSACGTGNPSAGRLVTTLAPLGTPTATAASLMACTSFRANWTAAANGPAGYFLDVATDAGFTTLVVNNLNVGNVTNYTVTGLTLNTTYYYRVRAFNACGTTVSSNTITTATTNIPNTPVANAATLMNDCSFRANWAAAAGATSYVIDVALDAGFTALVVNNLNVGNTTLYNATGLTSSTTYYYRVRAVNVCGTTISSNTITTATTADPGAPTANAPTAIGCTNFTANWSVLAGATEYRLDVSTDPAFGAGTFVVGYQDRDVNNVLTFNVTGLNGSTTYYYRVRGVFVAACAGGLNSNVQTVTTLAGPGPVTSQPATNVTCTSVTANWNFLGGATDYRFDLSLSPTFASFVQNNVLTGNVNSRNIAGLLPNTTYYYRVRAVAACGISVVQSATQTFTTEALPAPPVSLNATNVNCNDFEANWNTVGGAAGYFLDVSTNAAFTGILPAYNNLNVGNVSVYTVAGLTTGATYYYRIRSYTGLTGCVSTNSATQTVTLDGIPATPVSLPASNLWACQIDANWNPAFNAVGYRIDVSTNNTFTAILPAYNNLDVGNVTTFTITGLNPTTTYYYRVRAYNACGTTANSGTITQATPAAPALLPPVAQPATVVLSCRFNAEWTAIVGASNYYLDVSTDAGFGSFLPGYNNLDVGNVTSVPVVGLSPSTTYYYRLRGANPCGISAFSGSITVTTPANMGAPAPMAATGVFCGGFTANWGAEAAAQSYRLDVSTVSNFATLLPGYNNLDVGNVTSYAITGLTPGVTYYYRIRAVNLCGGTSSSGSVTTATPVVAPPTPQPYSNLMCTSFRANWAAVAGATSYILDVSTSPAFGAGTFLPGYNGVNVGNVTQFTVSPIAQQTVYYYRLRTVMGACGTSTNSVTETVDLTGGTHGLWTGNAGDSDWGNCINWSDRIVPTTGDDVVIPNGPATTPQNVPTITLNSLDLDHALGIRLVGDVTLSSYLRLASGVIDAQTNNRIVTVPSNATNAVRNAANTAITWANTAGYVAGRLSRGVVGGTAYTWPVGTLTSPQFATFHLGAVSGGLTSITGEFRATAGTYVPAEFFFENGADFNTMLPDGQWTFDPNAGDAAYDLEIWPNFATGCCAVYTFVKKHTTADPWDRAGSLPVYPSANGFSATGSLRRDGFTSFSNVAVVGSIIPLPVEGLSFTATLENGNDARLNWTVMAEQNNRGFGIQHAVGQPAGFTETAFVNSLGNTAQPRDYTHIHPGLTPGSHFFRLRQEDQDGTERLSPVVELRVAEDGTIIAAYPNPANHELNLDLTSLAGEVQLQFIDAQGRTVLATQAQGGGLRTLNLERLSAGIYALDIRATNGLHTTLRVVVNR